MKEILLGVAAPWAEMFSGEGMKFDCFDATALGEVELLQGFHDPDVDREGGGAAGLRKILEVLQQGNAIIIFPEGTRTVDGKLRAARSGIGLIVLKSQAPVVPVRVFGTFEAYGRHVPVPRPIPVAVKYGKPMTFQSLRWEARTCSKARLKEIYQEVAEEIMAAIAALQPCRDVERFPP